MLVEKYSKLYKNQSRRLIENGALLNNKLEPLKWIHFIMGLRSYRMKGSYFTKGPWWASLYLVCLIITLTINVTRSLINYLIEYQEVTLHNIAISFVYITSTMHLIMNCMLNINTFKIITVLEHFDYVERAIPRMNSFLYNTNNINVMIHVFEILYMLLPKVIKYKKTFSLSTYFMIMFNIASDFSIFQLCIMINMISSYGNVLNASICNFYKLPDYLLDNRNATIHVLKKYILQYASFDKRIKNNANFIETPNINTFVKINEKLLNNLSIINSRFNIIVSNNFVLLQHFSYHVWFFKRTNCDYKLFTVTFWTAVFSVSFDNWNIESCWHGKCKKNYNVLLILTFEYRRSRLQFNLSFLLKVHL